MAIRKISKGRYPGDALPYVSKIQVVTVSEPDNVQMGKICRELRQRNGKTLQAVSQQMGISVPYLSSLERGLRNWTRDLVRAFNKAR